MLRICGILIASILMFAFLLQESFADIETLTINLSSVKRPADFRASGFLHGISQYGPPIELVEPLKPRLFRAVIWDVGLADKPGIYEKVKTMGAAVQADLSSCYGCSPEGPCPGDNGDWSAWDDVLSKVLDAAENKRYKVQWDIWNEPNLREFWACDYDRYLGLWLRTVNKIRAKDSKAEIVGPSICGYDGKWLKKFLLWAKSNKVLPDIISWHEFESPRNIPACVSDLRAFLKENGISIKRFSLNEIVGQHHLTKPGPTAQYLWAIEETGIESAAHACWEDEEKGVYGCFTDSLDGIITPREKKPRSTWWVYRRYADITGNLVEVGQSDSLRGIAGRDDSKKQIALLIGREAQNKSNIRIRFTDIQSAYYFSDKVRVIVERIPDSGWAPLPNPQVIFDNVRQLWSDELVVIVPDLGPNDACFVKLCLP